MALKPPPPMALRPPPPPMALKPPPPMVLRPPAGAALLKPPPLPNPDAPVKAARAAGCDGAADKPDKPGNPDVAEVAGDEKPPVDAEVAGVVDAEVAPNAGLAKPAVAGDEKLPVAAADVAGVVDAEAEVVPNAKLLVAAEVAGDEKPPVEADVAPNAGLAKAAVAGNEKLAVDAEVAGVVDAVAGDEKLAVDAEVAGVVDAEVAPNAGARTLVVLAPLENAGILGAGSPSGAGRLGLLGDGLVCGESALAEVEAGLACGSAENWNGGAADCFGVDGSAGRLFACLCGVALPLAFASAVEIVSAGLPVVVVPLLEAVANEKFIAVAPPKVPAGFVAVDTAAAVGAKVIGDTTCAGVDGLLSCADKSDNSDFAAGGVVVVADGSALVVASGVPAGNAVPKPAVNDCCVGMNEAGVVVAGLPGVVVVAEAIALVNGAVGVAGGVAALGSTGDASAPMVGNADADVARDCLLRESITCGDAANATAGVDCCTGSVDFFAPLARRGVLRTKP
jgi:hypothetical protein